MSKKSLKKVLFSPIPSLKLDSSEFLLLLLVGLALVFYFAWQIGLVPEFLKGSMVLGIATP